MRRQSVYNAYSNLAVAALDVEEIAEGDSIIETLVELWFTADYFFVEPLMKDAIRMLESYCDTKLQIICRFGPEKTLPAINFVEDLLAGIRAAYHAESPVRWILVGFVWGGRLLFFEDQSLIALADEIPEFGKDIFKYMVGAVQTDFTPKQRALDFKHPKLEAGPTTSCTKCKKACGSKNPREWGIQYDPFQMKLQLGEACCISCAKAAEKPLWRL